MNGFTSTTPAVRIHAGVHALGHLPRELSRLGLERVFIVCGRSVATRTPLLLQVKNLLGERFAGAFTALGKDAPIQDVEAATVQAKAAGTDALIAIGAGSVIKAVRVIAILLAEQGNAQTLCTRYPDGAAPVSPQLQAPKVPIINILTAATSAQHRAGAALKNLPGQPRLEFFDPKTRPVAIFWDADALLTAPPALAFSTGLGVFWRALMNVGAVSHANPLVQASRLHAYTLAHTALPQMRDPENAQARINMCAAALLQNRDEDDGGRPMDAHWIARSVYALGAALFNQATQLDQGTTHILLTCPALRHFGDLCPETVVDIAHAMGLETETTGNGTQSVADIIGQWFAGLGVPVRLRDLGVSQDIFPQVIQHSLQNFNADRQRELPRHRARLEAMLHDAY
jgi:alcohol dehydrogenase class IV